MSCRKQSGTPLPPPSFFSRPRRHLCALSANRVDRPDRKKVCRQLSGNDVTRVRPRIDSRNGSGRRRLSVRRCENDVGSMPFDFFQKWVSRARAEEKRRVTPRLKKALNSDRETRLLWRIVRLVFEREGFGNGTTETIQLIIYGILKTNIYILLRV